MMNSLSSALKSSRSLHFWVILTAVMVEEMASCLFGFGSSRVLHPIEYVWIIFDVATKVYVFLIALKVCVLLILQILGDEVGDKSSCTTYCEPPKTVEFLIHFAFPPRISDAVIGDLGERYAQLWSPYSRRKALFWYWTQVFLIIRSGIWGAMKRFIAFCTVNFRLS